MLGLGLGINKANVIPSYKLTLNSIKDCFVNIWEPDISYNYNNIQIYNGGIADSMYSLLYFDLTDILGKNIKKAELNLYADNLTADTILGLNIIESSWDEDTTWNTRPTISETVYYLEHIPIGSSEWKILNILDLVRAVSNGAAYEGIWIFCGNDFNDYRWCQFSSSEGANIPYLSIEYY